MRKLENRNVVPLAVRDFERKPKAPGREVQLGPRNSRRNQLRYAANHPVTGGALRPMMGHSNFSREVVGSAAKNSLNRDVVEGGGGQNRIVVGTHGQTNKDVLRHGDALGCANRQPIYAVGRGVPAESASTAH
jgi:hypothetical protein